MQVEESGIGGSAPEEDGAAKSDGVSTMRDAYLFVLCVPLRRPRAAAIKYATIPTNTPTKAIPAIPISASVPPWIGVDGPGSCEDPEVVDAPRGGVSLGVFG